MPLDLDQLEQAKQAAISKGYSQQEVDAFAQTVIAKQDKRDRYVSDAAEAVRRGYPGESIPQEYRVDVFNKMGSDGIPFTAGERTQQEDEIGEVSDARQEVKLYRNKAKNWDDLSDDARSLALDIGIDVPEEASEEGKIIATELAKATAQKQNVANQVKRKAQNVLAVLDKYNGVIKGEQALAEYEYVVGDYNKYVFDEAGKQFPAAEKAMVAGSLITVEEARTQNLWQRVTGDVPEPTAKVMDSVGKVRAKLNIGIKTADQVLGIEDIAGDDKSPGLDLDVDPTSAQPMPQQGLDISQYKETGIDIINRMADFAPGLFGAVAGFAGAALGTPTGPGAIATGAAGAAAGYGAGLAVDETIENLTGRQDETIKELAIESVQKPLTAGALDAVFGKGFKLAGKLVPSGMKKTLIQKLAGVTAKVWTEYAESTGKDLVESSAAWFSKSSNWDELIGTVNDKFSKGLMHTTKDEAEAKIQKAVTKAGDDVVVEFEVFKKIIEKDMEPLGAVGGNATKRKAMKKVLDETELIYESGLTAENLLKLKRSGDKKFGKKVISPSTKESAINYVQKRFANISRNILKTNFDDIREALDIEHEILQLLPIFKKQVANEAVNKNLLPSMRGSGIMGIVQAGIESKATAKYLKPGLDVLQHALPASITGKIPGLDIKPNIPPDASRDEILNNKLYR